MHRLGHPPTSRMLGIAGRAAAGGTLVVTAQLAWVVARPLPGFTDLDASGVEGREDGTPLRMVVLGDSSCTGPSLEDPADIWVRQLGRMIGDSFRVDVRSVAIGGSRALDVIRRQIDRAVELAPDIAVVSVGANDAFRGVPVRVFERRLDAIVSALTGASRLVVLSGVGDLGSIPRLPEPSRSWFRRRGWALNLAHQRVGARHGAVVADQWAWATGEFARRPELFCPDLFHPGPDGHRLWAMVAHEAIAPHLDRFG